MSFERLKIIRFRRQKYLWNPHLELFPNPTITFQLNDFFYSLSLSDDGSVPELSSTSPFLNLGILSVQENLPRNSIRDS